MCNTGRERPTCVLSYREISQLVSFVCPSAPSTLLAGVLHAQPGLTFYSSLQLDHQQPFFKEFWFCISRILKVFFNQDDDVRASTSLCRHHKGCVRLPPSTSGKEQSQAGRNKVKRVNTCQNCRQLPDLSMHGSINGITRAHGHS